MFETKRKHRREFLTGALAALFSRRVAGPSSIPSAWRGNKESPEEILPGDPGWRDRGAPGSVAGEEADAGGGGDDGQ